MKHILLTLTAFSLVLLTGCGTTQLPQPLVEQAEPTLPCIGVECREQPTTPEAYIPIFAEQIKHYNEIADTVRPNNGVKDMDAIVVTKDKTKARKIDTNGNRTGIRVEEADQYANTIGYDGEYHLGTSSEGRKFMVITLSENELTDFDRLQRYAYLGTYDLFITYEHEAFHALEQPKWAAVSGDITNGDRNEFLEAYEARATREVLIQQLLNAFSYPKEMITYVKKAVATYKYYKTTFPDDAKNFQYFDRKEGTAYFSELVSSLQVGYPSLKTIDDLYRAYGMKIAPKIEIIPSRAGGMRQAYAAGGLAGFLLDYLEADQKVVGSWKEEIMNDSTKSPLDILAERFESQISPSDVVYPSEELLAKYKELAQPKTVDLNSPESQETIKTLVKMLKDMKSQSEEAYQATLEGLKEKPAVLEEVLKQMGG